MLQLTYTLQLEVSEALTPHEIKAIQQDLRIAAEHVVKKAEGLIQHDDLDVRRVQIYQVS